jgi:crotonobetainyl-CoA:carnitine CoA-transferase CaiB-like acyl-CoA transferase
MLAGFGADVIKIERPGEGDPARRLGPFLNDEPGLERSGLFLYLNSNKKSITLNLKSKTGAGIFRELVRDADIVVENFRPGVMSRLGLDYPALKRIKPGLVMTSISNFGQTGPYRDYKSAHLIAWGMSGVRYSDGAPGVRPVQIGGWLTHHITGIFAAAGTASALYHCRQTGIGQHVDVSIMESIILVTCYPVVAYSYLGLLHNAISKERLGLFPCKDGYIGLNLFGRLNIEMMTAFFGVPELAQDPRLQDPSLVPEFLEEARERILPRVKEREKMELFLSGVEWRIPFGLVPTTQEVLDSPQHKARGFFEEVDHPVMGRVTMPGAPFKMTETPWQQKTPAPLLGEHNEAIYGALGYSREDLTRLRETGII